MAISPSSGLRGAARLLRDRSGQMAVELAVSIPVMLVLVVIACDLMVFLGDCARFDRVAPELVRQAAASPESDGANDIPGVVEAGLEDACGGEGRLDFRVVDEGGVIGHAVGGAAGNVISFAPQPHRYRVILEYTPWPLPRGAFGFSPAPITHERVYVVDPYRFGVVV